jgi:protein O-mannosyl-transferase
MTDRKGIKQGKIKPKQVLPAGAPQKTREGSKQHQSPAGATEPPYARGLTIAVILLFTFIAFFPSLKNDFLKTWDDQAYVTNNELIKNLSGNSILKIFKEDRGLYANYHPLTTLSLAVNYHFSKTDPFGYHLTNLLLHLLNTLLVFSFIYGITKRNTAIAAVTALLFGLSPVHVESVAWISERKDVLYAFFFLASLVAYLNFLRRSDWKWYGLSILLFLCSLLSKAMAASLPLVLILVGFLENRRWNWKLIPDKIPFFAMAIVFGLYAVRIQSEGNAIGGVIFPFVMRVFHACYGFTAYILKTFLPYGLSAFYPYPYPLINATWVTDTIPPVFYLTFITTTAIFFGAVYCIASGKKNLVVPGFGLLFYACTIALVLQFLPVGRAIMADRYAYIPSVGLFFTAGHFAGILYYKKAFRIPVLAVVALYAGFMFFLTREQSKVWENDETLWTNVVRNYPNDNRIALAYANRANYFQSVGKPVKR